MSLRATSWAWSVEAGSATHKLVLLALAEHADEVGHCWPSVARIVEMTELSERAVRTAIGALVASGLVAVERSGNGRGHTSRYALQIRATPERGQEPPPFGSERRHDAPPFDAERRHETHPLTPERGNVAHPSSAERVQQVPERVHLLPERVRVVPKRVQQVHPEPSRTVIEPSVNLSSPPPASKRGHRLPHDWQPSPEDAGFADRLGLNADEMAAEFRDYWQGVPGARGLKLDWSATFRNSCRMQAKRKPAARASQARPWWLEDMLDDRR